MSATATASDLALAANTPVIVGVAQHVVRGFAPREELLSPVELATLVARAALTDTGVGAQLTPEIDTLAAIRFFEHSTRGEAMIAHPFGCSDNVPLAIARRLGAEPATLIYSDVGGHTPQRLVNRCCEQIFRGETQVALLTGAEAIATIKQAIRKDVLLDWREEVGGSFEDEWASDKLANAYERAHGLYLPLRVYPLLEHALRHRLGLNPAQYRSRMGELFAPFSAVAAHNPYAQFPVARSAVELARVSEENYLISDPYPKFLVAQDAVNQAAAVVLTSVGVARRLGIPAEKWAFLRSHADLDDHTVSARIAFERSLAQELALAHAVEAAGVSARALTALDLYSCFPIAVFTACAALDLDWRDSPALTLTGGLPYFGGPGNNYSMHAIAEAVARVRRQRDAKVLVAANGGYLSKHAVGVYAGALDCPWQPCDNASITARFNAIPPMPLADPAPEAGIVESYVLTYHRGVPAVAYVAAQTNSRQARFLARVAPDDHATLAALERGDAIGRSIEILPGKPANLGRITA